MDPLSHELTEAREKVGFCPCLFCYVVGHIDDDEVINEMEVRWSLLGERPYREDIQLKCPECKLTLMMGFGLSEQQFEEKMRLRESKLLDPATDDIEIVDKELLSDLGYVV